MRRNFRVSFDVGGGDGSLEDHLHSVAEAFFADRTVDDIAIGANIESGNVEFDASADASTAREAMETVALAVLRSIHAAGGQVIDSFTVVALDPEPCNTYIGTLTSGLTVRNLHLNTYLSRYGDTRMNQTMKLVDRLLQEKRSVSLATYLANQRLAGVSLEQSARDLSDVTDGVVAVSYGTIRRWCQKLGIDTSAPGSAA